MTSIIPNLDYATQHAQTEEPLEGAPVKAEGAAGYSLESAFAALSKQASQSPVPQTHPTPAKPHALRGVRTGTGMSAGKAVAWTTAALACLMGVARGYPCTGYDPTANQYFINGNKTLYGVVHGWFSDCYDYSYPCGTSCSSTGSSSTCWTVYCEATASDQPPSHYVDNAATKVKNCGFDLVDVNSLPGTDGVRIANGTGGVRIANGKIEKQLWVKVAVNKLNLTDETDPSIECLHGIA